MYLIPTAVAGSLCAVVIFLIVVANQIRKRQQKLNSRYVRIVRLPSRFRAGVFLEKVAFFGRYFLFFFSRNPFHVYLKSSLKV